MGLTDLRQSWALLRREAELSVPVKDVHERGGGSGLEGVIVRAIGYRVISSWQELATAIKRGWYRSEGTYTVRSLEGETQFATEMNDALQWSGGGGRAVEHRPVAMIEADLSELAFRSLHNISDVSFSGKSSGLGSLGFDTGAGIGIVGAIPLSRIKAVHVIEEGKIVRSLSSSEWQGYVKAQNSPETPQSESYDDWRSWQARVCVSPTGSLLHRYLSSGTACGKSGFTFSDSWFVSLIKVFPLGDEFASASDWRWKGTAVLHPKSGKKLDKCSGCWDEFADAMSGISLLMLRSKKKLPSLDSANFSKELAAYDAVVMKQFQLVRDPNFKSKAPKNRW